MIRLSVSMWHKRDEEKRESHRGRWGRWVQTRGSGNFSKLICSLRYSNVSLIYHPWVHTKNAPSQLIGRNDSVSKRATSQDEKPCSSFVFKLVETPTNNTHCPKGNYRHFSNRFYKLPVQQNRWTDSSWTASTFKCEKAK